MPGVFAEALTQLRENAATQALESRTAADQYARITAAFPVTQTSSDNLKATVVEFQRIARLSATPEAAFAHVSRVLERFPQFELDRISWSVGRPEERAKPAAAPAEPAPPGAPAGSEAVRIEISGRVTAMQRDDYRGITAQVQTFAMVLADSGFQPLILAPISVFLSSGASEKSGGTTRRAVTINGSPGSESWTPAGRNGEVVVLVAQRFVVTATARGIGDLDAARAVVRAVDFGRLAGLR